MKDKRTESRKTTYEKDQAFNRIVSFVHVARYKYINRFFCRLRKEKNHTINVLEIGAAHGKLYEVLDANFNINYLGIEIKKKMAEVAYERFGHRSNFSIMNDSILDVIEKVKQLEVDVIICLETLEHIPERDVARLMEHLALTKAEFFIFSVPVEVGPIVWFKNIGSFLMRYHRHKRYTWRETFWAGLYKLHKIPPHKTAHKGFDWRWLAHTIHQNLSIIKLQKIPFKWLPAAFANSVFFIVQKKASKDPD